MEPGPANAEVAEMLAPFKDILPEDTIQGYALPVSDGSARNRAGIRAAMQALEDADFTAQDGTMRNNAGKPLSFAILLSKGSTENMAIAELYIQALKRLGIEATVDAVDDAQFVARNNEFDFDMAIFRRALSLSPGNEQRYYWGSEAADQPGSRNLMGVKSPAIDALIDRMVGAKSTQEFTTATRALDRVLTAGRYVIPFWQFTQDRIAHIAALKYPGHVPLYGDGPNYMPEVWWIDPNR
jgi:peptide/nickel transport system substrate-binding protein